MFENIQVEGYLQQIMDKIQNSLLVWSNLLELIVFIVLTASAFFLSKFLYSHVEDLLSKIKALTKRKKLRIIDQLLFPLILMILIGFYFVAAAALNLPTVIIGIFGNLVSAWLIVKVISLFFPRNRMFRFLSALIWIIAALRILNIYQETINLLDSLAFNSGNLRISLLLIIKVVIIFSVLFWLAGKLSRLITGRIDKSEDLTPSVKVLLTKIAKFLIFTSAILFTLSAVGIDLSAFAFLGGAIGVGLGFGLQKIVSNFISGIIILADKSIKPGDVVEIGDVYGWVRKLDTRFVSVVTRSGKEFLIPNEDFITKEVINWSYSDELVRVEAKVGVAYNSDLRLVQELMMQSITEKERILTDPAPNVLLMGFGDSSVNFELRFWISDPRNGIQNIRSQVLLSIWDSFKENNVEIPFPQRDHHLKSLPDDLNNFLNQNREIKQKDKAKNNNSENKGQDNNEQDKLDKDG
ncbi:mechanosensitive ion channel-like protein [Halanaerobium saccharolyticum]|uniref:Mechanosensitive ion channel-like protein n=1 Tax=Halanaerobium saccharolyticum TaxID=43595 RepID=A0A4R7Z0M6_9FIRM|nr:mechanosensitive ion channel domain-containing protein [Halanaerobium saccharolyticum]RAK08466.1 mechanosensitive ion channel-like protein [Halanaerobium saccharolyticum]TDW03499.1 mechanosensitive ion channel-like protein [Halanaerobium saccharolyticum]TDX59958.1 mechanosensitive ion channel-like protein [Halanaerobium saccharolyticum]